MLHHRAFLFAALLVVLAALPAVANTASASASDCQLVLGFKTLHDQIPSTVGDCLDNEAHNPANGDAIQHTTKGLLAWRKADNFTAFTDGARTWINGPYGVQERANGQRFPWEANPDGLPLIATSGVERCHTNQLAVAQDGGGVAVGNVGVSFTIRSLAAQTCSLFGYPGAQLLDSNSRPMPTTLRWSLNGYLIGTVQEQTVVLPTGATAFFVLEYTDVPGRGDSCPTASYLRVTPPDEFTSLVIPVHGVAPCGGRMTASPVLAQNPLGQ